MILYFALKEWSNVASQSLKPIAVATLQEDSLYSSYHLCQNSSEIQAQLLYTFVLTKGIKIPDRSSQIFILSKLPNFIWVSIINLPVFFWRPPEQKLSFAIRHKQGKLLVAISVAKMFHGEWSQLHVVFNLCQGAAGAAKLELLGGVAVLTVSVMISAA